MVLSDPRLTARYARELEAPFAANDYDGCPEVSPDGFTWLAAPGRVLLSAPHSVNHQREGRVKLAEPYTGALAYAVWEASGQPVIARTHGPAGDPNWDADSAYKEAIRAAARRGDIRCVVDLHGAALRRGFDVALGTAGVDLPWLEDVVAVFDRAGLSRVTVNQPRFNAAHPGTVTWLAGRELHLPALQIELNRFWREPVDRPVEYEQALSALITLVDRLSERFR